MIFRKPALKKAAQGAAFAAFVFSATAESAVIDLGISTLDQNTGFEWLDLTVTNGMSYDAVISGVADTYNGGGWVVATRDEILAFWTSITGITSWPLYWTTDTAGAAHQVATFTGYTSQPLDPWQTGYNHFVQGHYVELLPGGGVDVQSFSLGAADRTPTLGYLGEWGSVPTDHNAFGGGTWLVRGNVIRPDPKPDGIVPDAVPVGSAVGFLGLGLLSLGALQHRRRKITRL